MFHKGSLSRGILNVGFVSAIVFGTVYNYAGMDSASSLANIAAKTVAVGGGVTVGAAGNMPAGFSEGLDATRQNVRSNASGTANVVPNAKTPEQLRQELLAETAKRKAAEQKLAAKPAPKKPAAKAAPKTAPAASKP